MDGDPPTGNRSPRASFVVVANRLAVERTVDRDGRATWRTSPGGLVTAITPLMGHRGGAWVGWDGAADEEVPPWRHDGIDMVAVPLAAEDVERYYEGMANATLWPLYHDALATPEYHREWWDAYVRVNRRFAEAAAAVAEPGATVWVQDYHLQLVPRQLRELRPDLRIGFFLHIPFPPPELFEQLPWRDDILCGLTGADVVGFQVPGAVRNFLGLVRKRLGWTVGPSSFQRPDGTHGRAGAYPISIDARGFEALANRPDVVARSHEIRADLNARTLYLGVDRLDYSKGLRQRVRAFGELFAEGRLHPGDAAFVQVATPSRERVREYRRLRDDLELLVGRINGTSGSIGRTPITYLHSSFVREEMAALYRAADVLVVTPLRDGMNLVAKEFIACRSSGDGALVLSEFAGAARELHQAWLVNPHDIQALKEGILAATRAPDKDKRRRMMALRRQVFAHDVDRWADAFLADLAAERPDVP